jgi:phosphate starvation-inducible protein PhoH and related proteins
LFHKDLSIKNLKIVAEKLIQLEAINPIDLYGINDHKLELLKQSFPKLKVIARGDIIKVIGDEAEIESFEDKLNRMIEHFHQYGNLTENNVERILEPLDDKAVETSEEAGDVLVFGNSGLLVKARSVNQRRMVDAYAKNDMVFAIGPAGTGKTYTAVALAVRALKNREVKKIILTRPAVEAGETLGFLPGDLKEKLDPYLQPLYDALRDMLPAEKLASYLETGIIQIAPLAFMRGRTLDNAFVILDESQNATESQIKMFLTRMGRSAKFYITGDLTQVDLPRNQKSGLVHSMRILKDIEGIEFVFLDNRDVLRHKLVKAIIDAYDAEEKLG